VTYSLHCNACGSAFEAKRPHARYCSDACRTRHWKGAGGQGAQPDSERVLAQPFDRDRILTALKARGSQGIHSHEIRRLGLSGHPSMRISELEERGYSIEHHREHKGRRPGVRYVLVSEPRSVSEAKAA